MYLLASYGKRFLCQSYTVILNYFTGTLKGMAEIFYKRCKVCQKFFSPIRSDQVFCGDKCRKKYKYYNTLPKINKTCNQCGIKFITSNPHKVFCSDLCRQKYHSKIKEAKEIKCAYCGRILVTSNSRKKYHSECYYKAKLEREKERKEKERNNE